MYICIYILHLHTYACVHTYMCICAYTSSTYIHICILIHIYSMPGYVCMYINIYALDTTSSQGGGGVLSQNYTVCLWPLFYHRFS